MRLWPIWYLVGITVGCDAVSPLGAAIMGAISAHGVCGSLGTIFTGLFATGVSTEKGLFYGGGFQLLGVQTLGVLSMAAYVAVIITIVFLIIKKTIGLRAEPAEEIAGLDISEHGLLTAYAGFATLPDTAAEDGLVMVSGNVPEAEANLLPKVQAEMVISKVPVRTVVETAKKVLYTGHIGDGKIFVYDVGERCESASR